MILDEIGLSKFYTLCIEKVSTLSSKGVLLQNIDCVLQQKKRHWSVSYPLLRGLSAV